MARFTSHDIALPRCLLSSNLRSLPDAQDPTPEDRQALKGFFHLFSRLYPCGECATEFQKLLKEYPPQVCAFQQDKKSLLMPDRVPQIGQLVAMSCA